MATQHPEHHLVIVSWNTKDLKLLNSLSDDLAGRLGNDHYHCRTWNWLEAAGESFPSFWNRTLNPIEARVRRLRMFLRQRPFRNDDEHSDPEITLIGYGKGCRILKQYLVDSVGESHQEWRDRRRIRQVLFLMPRRLRRTRSLLWSAVGIAALSIASYAWSRLRPNAPPLFDVIAYAGGILVALMFAAMQVFTNQEALRHLGLQNAFDSDELDQKFDELIVNGTKHRPGTWPVPSTTISLKGVTSVSEFAAAIFDAVETPQGHKNVHEITRHSLEIQAAPVDPVTLPASVLLKGTFDNQSQRSVSIAFSEGNQTGGSKDLAPYDLKFRTNGCMEVGGAPYPNLWTSQEQGEWEAHRKVFHYKFRPTPGLCYALSLTIYGGFNQGDRSAHTHIDVTSYIRTLEQSLDLRAYLNAGWEISREPEVYYIPPRDPVAIQNDRVFPDETCDCITSGRSILSGRRLEVNRVEPGLYKWIIYSVRNGGLLGFIFDVAAPAVSVDAADSAVMLAGEDASKAAESTKSVV